MGLGVPRLSIFLLLVAVVVVLSIGQKRKLSKVEALGGSVTVDDSPAWLTSLMGLDGCYLHMPRPQPSLHGDCHAYLWDGAGDEGLAAVARLRCVVAIQAPNTSVTDAGLRSLRLRRDPTWERVELDLSAA